MTRLSDTQCVVLSAAARDEDGRVRLPEKLRGGAADAVLKKLEALGLIARLSGQAARADVAGGTAFRITAAGLDAVDDDDVASTADAPVVAASGARDGTGEADVARHAKPFRPGTKGAAVVELLARPEGASLADLVTATG